MPQTIHFEGVPLGFSLAVFQNHPPHTHTHSFKATTDIEFLCKKLSDFPETYLWAATSLGTFYQELGKGNCFFRNHTSYDVNHPDTVISLGADWPRIRATFVWDVGG